MPHDVLLPLLLDEYIAKELHTPPGTPAGHGNALAACIVQGCPPPAQHSLLAFSACGAIGGYHSNFFVELCQQVSAFQEGTTPFPAGKRLTAKDFGSSTQPHLQLQYTNPLKGACGCGLHVACHGSTTHSSLDRALHALPATGEQLALNVFNAGHGGGIEVRLTAAEEGRGGST